MGNCPVTSVGREEEKERRMRGKEYGIVLPAYI
jgi:hypothetical protein